MSEQKMLKATFFAALAVLFVSALGLVVSFLVFVSSAGLEKRIAALEATQAQSEQPPKK